jgi:hypothetical protein
MRHPTPSTAYLTFAAMAVALAAVQGCSDDHGPKPVLGPSTLVLRLPPAFGDLDRPAVDFDHEKHTQAMGVEACKTCHEEGSGKLVFDSIGMKAASAEEATNAYHDNCIGCHRTRASEGKSTGPVTCGGCHAHKQGSSFARANLRFDYSLHHRHDKAEEGKCETCHHVYDEDQKKLVYKKGEESACRDCHGSQDRENVPSVRRASHDACVNCHSQRAAKGEATGPTLCGGCHDGQQIASIKPVDSVPRLMRGQPDMTWIRAAGATAALVPFDHAKHEPLAASCSSCHHQTLRACKDCHSLVGKAEGGHVTLERAYHHPKATQSCVGCHQQRTQQPNCAGCHHSLPQAPQGGSCGACHAGPSAKTEAASLPEPSLSPVQIDGLPPTSDAFPGDIKLEYMQGGEYGPADLPHRRIVERLDRATRSDKLAARFHGGIDTLCAGCHHHSPVGARPPKCVSCHAADNDPTQDRPGLKAAFHRQCIECHQQMEIATGCTDCHAETSKEGKQ